MDPSRTDAVGVGVWDVSQNSTNGLFGVASTGTMPLTTPNQGLKACATGALFTMSDHLSGIVKSADRKSTRLNSSHDQISYAVFCLKKKKTKILSIRTYPT